MRCTDREWLYYRLFGADAELRRHLSEGDDVLDVGCSDGRGSVLLSERPAFGVDIYRPALAAGASVGRRKGVVQADIRQLPYRSRAFDVCVALDVIEHLAKPESIALIGEMERVASKAVCVLTPSGFVEQPGTDLEPWQEHRCGYVPDELVALGYEVVGIGGWGPLRGSLASFRLGPLGALAAVLSQPVTRSRPSHAYHLFAIKRLG